MDTIEEVVEKILESKYCIAFTGSGISVESGIPSFRGPNGLWKKYRPEELATPQAFSRDPIRVWEWYKWRMELIFKAKPNPAHRVLAELERLGFLKCIITQNIDDLHRLAGSKCIVELHGNIKRARCISCGYRVTWNKPPEEIPPHCPRCNSLLRPDVVWFGEELPRDQWMKALEHTNKADLVLVIGTSGVVYPAAMIPYIVKENGGIVVEINIEDTALTNIADYILRGRAGEILESIYRVLKQRIERL
ncbi:MAG: NAD-dependent protein deacylase [Desulfurococcales archaeon ex4484_58]|nr:MAG: NAD-dependent protein deacylase [Desulfurococcales archaeon ex4484_58]